MSNLAKRAYGTVFKAIQRYDLSEWDCKPECDTPIYGVYHVFCDKGWQELVADQIRRLKDSGLYSATKRLYISCIVKDEAQADELMSLIDADKAELISVSTDPMKFEYPALEFIREKSGAEDCFIYYFHTKGISYYAGERTDRHFLALRRNIEAWRHMMEYFLFYKWQVAVNVLDEGYDTYGCSACRPTPRNITSTQATSGGCAPTTCAGCRRSPGSALPPTGLLPRSGFTRPGRWTSRPSTPWPTSTLSTWTRRCIRQSGCRWADG